MVTQLVATIISVYGILMPALGWKYAGVVWGYALVWFFIEDRVKLFAYKVFGEPHTAVYPKAVKT